MLTCQNVEEVHGQRKVGNPCSSKIIVIKHPTEIFLERSHFTAIQI